MIKDTDNSYNLWTRYTTGATGANSDYSRIVRARKEGESVQRSLMEATFGHEEHHEDGHGDKRPCASAALEDSKRRGRDVRHAVETCAGEELPALQCRVARRLRAAVPPEHSLRCDVLSAELRVFCSRMCELRQNRGGEEE